MSEPTGDLTSPHNLDGEGDWLPNATDLKSYPHFDKLVHLSEIGPLVRDPLRVASHKFHPLLYFKQAWRRPPKKLGVAAQKVLGRKSVAGKKKEREIRYPCRRDSYIYKHYREKMSPLYETKLAEAGIADSVRAYRKIPTAPGSGVNKSNIHFALEAFEAIDALGTCSAIAIDISKFFESIDHELLKVAWQNLIGVERLPADHFAVFKSVTAYHWVDLTAAFVALGHSRIETIKRKNRRPVDIVRFAIPPQDIPKRICTPSDFRKKIVGGGLVQRNVKPHGIPQGTPISDFLANLYMFEVDRALHQYASKRGGRYFRYSDDILLVMPGDGRMARAAARKVQIEIEKAGPQLRINTSKTEVVCFTPTERDRCYALKLIDDKTKTRVRMSENEGLSYLGFRYDGRKIYLRNGTITNLRGKIARTCKAVALAHVTRYRGKSLDALHELAPIEQIKQQFLQVKDFEEAVQKTQFSRYDAMTFWSYASRARKIFGARGSPIRRQLRRTEMHIRESLKRSIDLAFAADAKRRQRAGGA